jgi:hypothetical protein
MARRKKKGPAEKAFARLQKLIERRLEEQPSLVTVWDQIMALSGEEPMAAVHAAFDFGFFTQEQFQDAMWQAEQKPNLPYPWSDLPTADLRILMQGPRSGLGGQVRKVMGRYDWTNPMFEGREEIARRLLTSMGIWLRGKKRLIRVSKSSQSILMDVARKRLQERRTIARWSEIPAPGSHLYDEGLIFYWEGEVPALTFVQSTGVIFAEAIRYTHWLKEESGEWGTVGSIPAVIDREWFERAVRLADMHEEVLMLDKYGLTAREAIEAARAGEELPREVVGVLSRAQTLQFMHMAVNLLAALNQEVRFDFIRQAPGTNKKGLRSVGGIKSVKSLEISEDGLHVWSKHYVTLGDAGDGDEHEEAARQEYEEQGGTHASPSLHYRKDHLWTVWVRKPEPGEEVVGTRENILKSGEKVTLYGVLRERKGGPVGGRLDPREERVRAGLDDLNVRINPNTNNTK